MRPHVVVARLLLPEGLGPLEDRYEVRSGGLDADREALLELAPGAAALVADASVPVDEQLLEACGAGLRVVANFAVGYDNVDLEACAERGIVVTNTPGALTEATAELALALALWAGRLASDAERDLRAGRWEGWNPAGYLGREIRDALVGVVGLGRIGTRFAEMAHGLGARIAYCSPSPKPEVEQALVAKRMSLDELCEAADYLSVHAPGGPHTRGLIGERQMELLGTRGTLVNTSRGSLVDADALAAVLGDGRLGAAGLDVYEDEPSVPAPLLEAPRCVLLPHIGSATDRSRGAMARLVADNVIAVLEGSEPPARVV